jgi:hypothetical protein
MDQGSLSCGWYQLKYDYWLDCGQPGGGKPILTFIFKNLVINWG